MPEYEMEKELKNRFVENNREPTKLTTTILITKKESGKNPHNNGNCPVRKDSTKPKDVSVANN